MILSTSGPEGEAGQLHPQEGEAARPQEWNPWYRLCQLQRLSRDRVGEIPQSHFFPMLSLGFPFGEHGPRSEVRGQDYRTHRSVSRAQTG